MGADGKEKSKTRAQQRAAGTKKTALFDIVNRNSAATRSCPGRACEGARRHVPPSCPGRPGVDFVHGVGSRARAGTQEPNDVPQQADIVLCTFLAGSTQVGFTRLARIQAPISGKPEIGVSFRFAPLARDTRVARVGASRLNPAVRRAR